MISAFIYNLVPSKKDRPRMSDGGLTKHSPSIRESPSAIVKPIVPPQIPYTDSTPDWSNFVNQKVTIGYFMSAIHKQAYLLSAEWYNLRTLVFERDGYRCQLCGSTNRLECHHITYKRLGAEWLTDLTTLCGGPDGCHNKIHDRLGYNRTTKYPVN